MRNMRVKMPHQEKETIYRGLKTEGVIEQSPKTLRDSKPLEDLNH
jgi:hypothetical protein